MNSIKSENNSTYHIEIPSLVLKSFWTTILHWECSIDTWKKKLLLLGRAFFFHFWIVIIWAIVLNKKMIPSQQSIRVLSTFWNPCVSLIYIQNSWHFVLHTCIRDTDLKMTSSKLKFVYKKNWKSERTTIA